MRRIVVYLTILLSGCTDDEAANAVDCAVFKNEGFGLDGGPCIFNVAGLGAFKDSEDIPYARSGGYPDGGRIEHISGSRYAQSAKVWDGRGQAVLLKDLKRCVWVRCE